MHSVCTGLKWRNMRINTIKGALWALETKKVRLFFVFDLEARHERMWALISNRGSQIHFFLSLYSEDGNHICIHFKGAKKDLAIHIRMWLGNISKLTRGRRGR